MKTFLAIAFLASSSLFALSPSDLRKHFPLAQIGDDNYIKVNADQVPKLHKIFLNGINKLGMPAKWDKGFDCNKLVSTFVVVNQVKHSLNNWHGSLSTLAIGELWYTTGNQSHAVIVAIGDSVSFWDVQTAKTISLPPNARVILVKF